MPDLDLSAVADLDGATAALEEPLLTATVVRSCALALRAVPRANGSYRDGRYELYSRINVGVVVADDHSYSIPTLFDCERKSVQELADEFAEARTPGAGR